MSSTENFPPGTFILPFLLEEFEKERAKRKSRKSDIFIDADVNFGYNGTDS